MSAARHIPMTAVTHNINIDSAFTPSPKYLVVGYGDTIWFYNNSGVSITIVCGANPPGPQVGGTLVVPTTPTGAGFTVPNTDAATNYFIYQTGNPTPKSGPWPIQVENGCMYITVNATFTAPDPVAIPPAGNPGGKIEMYSTDGNNYDLAWTNGDPFTPLVSSITPTGNSVQTVNTTSTAKDYAYTVHLHNSPTEGQGGGTVKIRG